MSGNWKRTGPDNRVRGSAGQKMRERRMAMTDGLCEMCDAEGLVVLAMRDGRATGSGVHVNEMTALRNSTYFRGENLISSAIGMLPTFLMRRTIDRDGREKIEKATDHPLYRLLKKRPNGYQTALEFKSYMTTPTRLSSSNAWTETNIA